MNNYEYWHEYFPSDTVPNTMGRRDTTVYSIYNDPKILDEKRQQGELAYCLNRHHFSVEIKDQILNWIATAF